MNEIINLEEIRLSRLDHDELLVESIEKMSEHMVAQAKLIKDLTLRTRFSLYYFRAVLISQPYASLRTHSLSSSSASLFFLTWQVVAYLTYS